MHHFRVTRTGTLTLASVCLLGARAIAAQSTAAPPPSAASRALAGWIALDAPPADAERAGAALRRRDPRWVADAQGNLVKRVGSGRPRRLVACGLDQPGHVVGAITDAGYLRLHRAGRASMHPLWDQFHEGQQIVVRTAAGEVPGVVAIANAHFARQHRADTTVVGVDQLWVDVGARTAAEARAMGIALIDPVRRDLPAWSYAAHVAGADASGRAGCAAVAAAAEGTPAAGETVFVLSTLRGFTWAGLGAVVARTGPVDALVLVGSAARGTGSAGAVTRARARRPAELALAGETDTVTTLAVRARWAGALVESVHETDADSLRVAVAAAAGVAAGDAHWLVPDGTGRGPARAERRDSLSAIATVLQGLVELPGVPEDEWRVRDAIRAQLPAWARSRAQVDAAGNLVVAVGPARDTTVFVAHMDEVAYTVGAILGDGRVTLVQQGGLIPSAWEGQPALLHFDPAGAAPAGAAEGAGSVAASLPGVFVPRDSATTRRPPGAATAWFGLDSAALVARGVRAGQGLTAYKRGQRLGAVRFTGRALDDRAGSTALLLAARALDPTQLDHTVILVWSTAEETGLTGASALARRLGPSVRRTYAIDTFVSSDTPLEQPTFAYVPLGSGPVLRALDDATLAPREERVRVERLARAAGVPLQVGTTHGGTDATPFVAWGALGAGLSWPGRYSHSPAELLDLRDLVALARLITAVAAAPAR
jgi:putative aminopeptidase FrvX